jgi:5-methylcytosine-specific restriction endonuclease McrA
MKKTPHGLVYGVKADTHAGICYYCKESIDQYSTTVDHLIPESRGGIRANKNKVHSCQRCNNLKGDMTPEEFHKALTAMIKHANKEHRRNTGLFRKIQISLEELFKKKEP